MQLILRTERDTRKLRLLALLVAVLGLYLRQDQVDVWPAVALAAGYLAYILLFGYVALPRLRVRAVIYGMIILDATALALALRLAGGLDSPLFILLPLFIIYYSTYLGYASSLFAATVFSLGYIGVAFWLGLAARDWSLIAVQIPFLYLLAVFSGHLAQRRLEERREKEELQELIRLQQGAKGLIEVARDFGKSLELEVTLAEVARAAPRLLGFSDSLIALLESEDMLRARAGNVDPARLGLERLDQLVGPLRDDRLGSEALEKNMPVASNADLQEAAIPGWALKLGMRSVLAVPLVTRTQKVGLLYLMDANGRRHISQDFIDMAGGYGELAASALANALAYQQAQSKVGHLVNEMEVVITRLERLKQPARKRDLIVGELRIDGARGKVTLSNAPMSLSPTEFELLYVLAENAGAPVNPETLLRRVWGEDFRGQGNVVDVSIHRLRRKLDKGSQRKHIITVRGMGYMLTDGALR